MKNRINDYIKNNLNKNEKIKNYIETALRKFIQCFLTQIMQEKNPEKKIKENKNNIKNYLEIEDLWDKGFYKQNEFYQEIKKLKNLDIKVNNVIIFYEKCFNNTYKNYFDDVKTELENRKEEKLMQEKEKEKGDISNFNPKDNDIEIDNQQNEINNSGEINNNENTNNENNDMVEDENGNEYLDQGDDDDDLDNDRLNN